MLGYVIFSVVFALCVVILTMLHMRQASSVQADGERVVERLMEQQRLLNQLHENRVEKLFDHLQRLQSNLVARNDREFDLLYGNAPREAVVELSEQPYEEEYTQQVIDLAEDRFLLGLDDEPVGIPFPAE
jgi:hypothetical protein